jgi:hypothetical protein
MTLYLEGLWEETLGSGATVKTHYSFGGQLVAVRNSAPASLSYLHGDHLSSVRLATGTSGAVLNSQAFGPWGEEQAGSGVPQTSTDFTGQQRDPTGLLYSLSQPLNIAYNELYTTLRGEADDASHAGGCS